MCCCAVGVECVVGSVGAEGVVVLNVLLVLKVSECFHLSWLGRSRKGQNWRDGVL